MSSSGDWFRRARFGMCIHWGIYAVGAVHEQELWRYGKPPEEYRKYADRFDPRHFSPAAWLDLAEEAGMRYLVFTAKHHDGFCMWATRETDFNVTRTPFGRDVLAMLAEECHRRNFPLELYYSCVDWHHPAYPNLGRHHEIVTDPTRHDLAAYTEFVRRQLRELCTGYGKIHGIWWDMNVPEHFDPSINAMIRELQPGILINNRGYSPGDYTTPERELAGELTPFETPVEACNSVGMNSWGYRADEDYYSLRSLERQIALNLGRGGNYLLNAGPDADGRIPAPAADLLRRIGAWYRRVGGALAAPTLAGVYRIPRVLCTGDRRVVNLILLDSPDGETLMLPGIDRLPERAEWLNRGGAPVDFTMEPTAYKVWAPRCLRLRHLPVDEMHGEVQLIRLTFADELAAAPSSAAGEGAPVLL